MAHLEYSLQAIHVQLAIAEFLHDPHTMRMRQYSQELSHFFRQKRAPGHGISLLP
jgi:hypothetical protein